MRRQAQRAGVTAALVAAVAVCTAVATAGRQAAPAGPAYKLVGKWGKDGKGNGEFANPNGIAVDKSGNVFVADADNNRIQVFNAKGSFLRAWGSVGNGNDQFWIAQDVNIAPDGTVWVADQQNSRLQQFSAAGAFMTSIPLPVNELPRAIGVDKDGRVLAAANGEQTSGYRVYVNSGGAWQESGGLFAEAPYRMDEIEGSPDGTIWLGTTDDSNVSNTRAIRYSADGRSLGSFKVASQPEGLGIDLDCNVWAADFPQRRMVKYSPSGKVLATASVPDLLARDIAVAPHGDVYVIATGQGILHFAEDRAKPASALVPARLTATKKVVKVTYTLSGVACPDVVDATASLTGNGIAGKAAVKVAAGKATVLTIPLTKAASGPAKFTIVLKTNGRPTTQVAAVSLTAR